MTKDDLLPDDGPDSLDDAPQEMMSLFDLFLEPSAEDSVDVDEDDTAIIEIDEVRKRDR